MSTTGPPSNRSGVWNGRPPKLRLARAGASTRLIMGPTQFGRSDRRALDAGPDRRFHIVTVVYAIAGVRQIDRLYALVGEVTYRPWRRVSGAGTVLSPVRWNGSSRVNSLSNGLVHLPLK